MQPEPVAPRPVPSSPTSRGLLPATVAALATGLVLAVAAVVAPVLPASTAVLSAAVLLSFACGWALLALLRARSAPRQTWALVPAAFLVVAAVVASSRSPGLQRAFGWGWPPLLLGVAGWSLVQVHRRVGSAVARWLLHPVLTVLLLASVAGGAATVRDALQAPAEPSTDRLVDVGGHRLHLRCRGSGSPTAVLEPGLGAASADLRWIEPAVAAGTRVCVYDRAGRALSDDVDQPQDAARIAADLRTLLDRAGVPGPYVLAGHSFGGLYVLTFAARYPEQVAGLALLDSTSPAASPTDPAASGPATTVDRVAALAPALGRVSVGRGFGSSAQEWLMGARSVQEAASLRDLQATPLLVLTAGSGHDAAWFAAQRRLTTLSTNSLQRIAEDTTHESLVGDEHDAAAAARAVLDVVAAVRTSSPLRPA